MIIPMNSSMNLIHNYKIKLNDLQGMLRREKFTLSVGDELPAGIMKLAKIYIAKKRKLKVGVRWQDVTEIRVS